MDDGRQGVRRGSQGELLVYPARGKLLQGAALGAIMTVASLWVIFVFDSNSVIRSSTLADVIGAVGLLFFGAVTAFAVVRAASRPPLVVLDDEGILSRDSVWRLPFVRWDEISGVRIEEVSSMRQLRFDLKDPEALISRCRSPLSRKFHAHNLQRGFAVLSVGEKQVDIPLAELQSEVEKRLQ